MGHAMHGSASHLFANYRNTVMIRGLMELANCSVSNLNLNPPSELGQSVQIPAENIGTVTLSNVFISTILETGNPNAVRIEHTGGTVNFRNVQVQGLCSIDDGSFAMVYANHSGLFEWDGGAARIIGNGCSTAGSSVFEAVNTGAGTILRDMDLICSDDTRCVELEEDLSHVQLHQVRNSAQSYMFAFVNGVDGLQADGSLTITGTQIQRDNFDVDSFFGGNWDDANMKGAIQWTGTGAPGGSIATCFSGWTYQRRDGVNQGESFYVCEDGTWVSGRHPLQVVDDCPNVADGEQGDFCVDSSDTLWYCPVASCDAANWDLIAAGSSGSTLALTPTSSPPACDDAREGWLYYNSDIKEHCGCNGPGPTWSQLDGGGAC
jgi:hypothetical protein